jgi:hypothetical protein
MIKIDFEFETQYGKFADALWLSEDHTLTVDEIEALKQQRLTNWLAVIESPQAPEE